MAASDEHIKVVVRRATKADVPALVLLNEGLSAEDAGTRDPFARHGFDRWEYFTDLADDGERNVVWVACAGDAGIGYLVGRFRDPSEMRRVSTGVLESMFVHPDHRNAGIGAALVETFLQWARTAGAGAVAVTAYAENTGAIRFYERFGWRPMHVTLDMAM